jgi:cell division cycle 14
VTELDKLLKHPDYSSNIIYHYTSTDYAKAANSAYLMGAFQIIILNFSAEKAFEPFK